jgi:LmbE family N-acetylglucosaminyl deacetylase
MGFVIDRGSRAMDVAQAALLSVLATPDGHDLPPLPVTAVVTAHPGDETVGAGSRLPRLAQGLFVCVTDGSPRDGEDSARQGLTPADYARERHLELQTALVRCGIAPGRLLMLDCADQQAALQLATLAHRLAEAFTGHGIEVVLTQPYEGSHPDRDATAFAVHAAAAWLRRRGAAAPDLVEMSTCRRGADAFLPPLQGRRDAPVVVALTREERQRKADLLAIYATQQETLRGVPVDREAFRPAPRYDFLQPPLAGPLPYELQPWGMSGEGFRRLAAEALEALGLEGPL